MGQELDKNIFEEIADVFESEVKRQCGLALPEEDRASVLSFGDGLNQLLGEEQQEDLEEGGMKEEGIKKSGFRINRVNSGRRTQRNTEK